MVFYSVFYLATRSHSTTLLFDVSPSLPNSIDLLLLPLVVTKVAGAYFTLTVMDLEMVDYSKDELAEGTIWATSRLAKLGSILFNNDLHEAISGLPSLSGPPYHQIVLPDNPPTWSSLSTPPPPPSSLRFATGCLNLNPLSPSPGHFSQPPLSANPPTPLAPPSSSVPQIPLCITSLPSSSFTSIPPLAKSLPVDSSPPLVNPSAPVHIPVSRESLVAEVRITKKMKCFRTKEVDNFLRLEEDIGLSETMDFADRVLVG